MRTFSLVLVASVLSLLSTGCSNKISGSADVENKEHGDFAVLPTECSSGEHQEFFGVDLREGSKGRKIVRIKKEDEVGYVVSINIPKTEKAVIVNKSVCKTFKVKVKEQNSEINNIKNVKGSAKIKCDVEGFKVEANLKFENCH